MEEIRKELVEHEDELLRMLGMLERVRDEIEKGEDEAPCFFPILSTTEIDELIGLGEIYANEVNHVISKIDRRTKK